MIRDPIGRALRVVPHVKSDNPRTWKLNRRFHPRALRSESWTGRSPYAGSLLDVLRRALRSILLDVAALLP